MKDQDKQLTKIEINKLVSYSQYQSQFKKVLSKYHKLLDDKTFDSTGLPDKQRNMINILMTNFSF